MRTPSGITASEIQPAENRWNDLLRITRSWRLEWKLSQLLDRVAREAAEFLQMERGAVFLLASEGISRRSNWPAHAAEDPGEFEVANSVIRKGRPVFAHVVASRAQPRKRASSAVCCVPLTASRGILGALYVSSLKHLRSLPQQDQEFLEMLGLQAAVAIEHALLYQSAITDPLTNLFSHRHFQQEVEQAVRRSRRTRKSVSLIILDLDKFKNLNDTRGHEVGNKCLIQVAQILRESVRTTDVIARFGGDEFELLLPDSAAADAAVVADKIRRKICRLEFDPQVTATAGIAAFPENAADAQSLFLRADEALYEAKEAGRNQVKRSVAVAAAADATAGKENENRAIDEMLDLPLQIPYSKPTFSDDDSANLIDGHRVVRRLGMGSAGEVLLVQQPELEREVALKRPLTPHLTEDQRLAFEREAKATASLMHPGVVTVHTMGRDADGRQYYTMKPLNGPSLGQIMEALARNDLEMKRRYSQRHLLEILQRVAETIAYAHARGSVHLDLTPHNIVIGQFGETTVIDWGSGVSVTGKNGRASRSGGKLKYLVGSMGYAAPEQLPESRQAPGPHTDVHALGVILYEILTSKGPYRQTNTQDTIKSIVSTSLIAPEKAAPKASIEPVLSALCMRALARDAASRPSAADFAVQLGRYVRRDIDTTLRRFDAPKLDISEWIIGRGDWRVKNKELVTFSPDGGTIYFAARVPENFRFVCDCWAERSGELMLIGKNPGPSAYPWGIEFKFGCEYNTSTQLLHPEQARIIPGMRMTPGKHYKLSLSSHNGWYTAQLDDKTILEMREPYFMTGNHLGIGTWDAGVHFRPIELEWQNWGSTVPLLRLADEVMASKNFGRAAELYAELATKMAGSFEASEAVLKLAKCQQYQSKHAEARKSFLSLKSTMLKSFAISSLAQMEFGLKTLEGARAGLKLMRSPLLQDPNWSARPQYPPNVSVTGMQNGQKTEEIRAEVLRIRRGFHKPPTIAEVDSHSVRVYSLLKLGRHRAALNESLEFKKTVAPEFFKMKWQYEPVLIASYLASGRDDLLPRDAFALHRWEITQQDWSTGIAEHVVARTGTARAFLRGHKKGRTAKFGAAGLFQPFTALAANLILGRVADAAQWLDKFPPETTEPALIKLVGTAAADSLDTELFENWIKRCRAGASRQAWLMSHVAMMQAQFEINRGRPREAAECLRPLLLSDTCNWQWPDAALLQILTGSLGYLKGISRRDMKWHCENCLAGPARDLAHMFLKLKAPVPGELWPHRSWRPEFRLWLAIWLEANGQPRQASKIAASAIDKRYGLFHSQPALTALLKRVK